MILMNNVQILSAVVRGLEEHITPELQTDYARVQLASALKAVREVINRMEAGDQCIAENGRLEKIMQALAEEFRSELPKLAAAFEGGLKGADSMNDPREKNRSLKEAIWKILAGCERSVAMKILKPLLDNLMATMQEDQAWVCPEAVYSLS